MGHPGIGTLIADTTDGSHQDCPLYPVFPHGSGLRRSLEMRSSRDDAVIF